MSSVIGRDEAEGFERWRAPSMDDPAALAEAEAAEAEAEPEVEPEEPAGPTEEELAAIREEARREGYEQGHAEGREAGHETGLEEGRKQGHEEGYAAGLEEGRTEIAEQQEALAAKSAELDTLLGALARPFEDLDDEVEEQLVELVLAVGRQLIRRELRTEPGQIIAVVREAIAALPANTREYELHLHPEDAELVRETVAGDGEGEADEHDRPWRIVEDPALTRGGCQVISENSRVDATLEKRLAQVAANLLGGEREHDRTDAQG
jgi:flagellar assembly protein FliH